jgi:carbamate kinase
VVPSPHPVSVPEIGAIRSLLADGHVVVAAGGGGIPMVRAGRRWSGVEAVVDKDLTAALLAVALDAEHLVLLTDVAGVRAGTDPGDPEAPLLGRVRADGIDPDRFEAGSMAPKVEAAVRFARATGRWSAIGALEHADEVVAGDSGTIVLA